MTRSQYLLTVSSTIWIHLMVMFKQNQQAQLLEFERWHMDALLQNSILGQLCFHYCTMMWFLLKDAFKIEKRNHRGNLQPWVPMSFFGRYMISVPKSFTRHAAGLPLLLLGCPLDQLGSHVGMCCSWFHQMIMTKCHPLHIQDGLYYIICLISLNSIINDFDIYLYTLFWSNQIVHIGIAWYHHINHISRQTLYTNA